jgi:dolichol-phosphate mannosyltransferase
LSDHELGIIKRIAIIPACRNTLQLIKVLRAFPRKIVDEICIIIDAAGAGEVKLVENAAIQTKIPIHIIANNERKGVGLAIQEGIKYSLLKNYDIAIVMAGNGKDQPEEISRLLQPILNGKCDYVQGSRFLKGGKHVRNPFFRGLFSRIYPLLWNLLTKSKCTDVTNGFRAYKLSLFLDRRINIWQHWLEGYELEYYLHYKVITLGYKFTEVPVSKIYPFRHKGGYSNISPIKDWWKIVGPLLYLKIGLKK